MHSCIVSSRSFSYFPTLCVFTSIPIIVCFIYVQIHIFLILIKYQHQISLIVNSMEYVLIMHFFVDVIIRIKLVKLDKFDLE